MLMLCLTQACSSPAPARNTLPTEPSSWQSQRHQTHDLVGKIWLDREKRFINQHTLLAYLAEQPVLLLGEKHDNPDHHRLRLTLLVGLLGDAPRVLAMEMLEPSQQDAADKLHPESDPAALPTLLNWDSEGWPWQYYGPVVELALRTRTTLTAGNIGTDDIMQIYSGELAQGMPNPLTRPQIEALYHDIDNSHCGMLPESQFPAMVRIQQARDQRMAEALMIQAGPVQQRILLAGNYHIRHDLGVPNYLPADATAVSVAFLEVDPAQPSPESYLQGFSEQNAYDVVWFTPAVAAEDYCASMSGVSGSSNRSDN